MKKLPLVKAGKYEKSGNIIFDRPEIVLGIEHHPLFGKFKRGDIFLSSNPMMLGKMINAVSTMYSVDRNSEFSHSGLFINNTEILEASYTVSFDNFITKYEGDLVLVGRHNKMTNKTFDLGIEKIKEHIGQWYPFHRLALHFFNLAQYIHWNKVVCSELIAKFLFGAGLRDYKYYGVTPDMLADEIEHSLNDDRTGPQYEIVFKGKIPTNIYKRCEACGVNAFTTTDNQTCPICYTKTSLKAHGVFLPELIKYNKSKT